MAVEHLTKRTIWVAKCEDCGRRIERMENPPKEILCPCGKRWLKFTEESWTGPDKFAAQAGRL